jgi:hypothetical protein
MKFGRMKHRKSDILWKTIIEEVFADLLRFIYPDADQKYDMDRGFEFLDKELAELHMEPDEEKDSRFADKLVKVYRRDGVEQWLLLHIEVQGDTSDRDAFAERMFTYFTGSGITIPARWLPPWRSSRVRMGNGCPDSLPMSTRTPS